MDTEHTMEVQQAAWETGSVLPVMETFYTIQGEGLYQGHAAYFIRLAGCEVGCVWCDVKESWDASSYPLIPVTKLAEEAASQPGAMVVVTGGEPLGHRLDMLCNVLHEKGLRRHLETSGAYPLSGAWEWICLSPKKFKAPLPEICRLANELKVVVYNRSDFTWAEKYAAQVSAGCRLFLQPEWSRSAEMVPQIVSYVKKHPQWEISLQIHKFMEIP